MKINKQMIQSKNHNLKPKSQSDINKKPTCKAYTDVWQNTCTLERDRITDQSLRHRILSGCEATTTNTYPDWCEISPAQYYVDETGQLVPSDSINEFIADSNSKSKPHGMMVGGATGSGQLKTLINNISAHQELIDQIIETADSTQATSIDIDLEWPESITECKNLLQFLMTLKEQAGEHPIHFALHPFYNIGMYFNHEVEVDGKTFKTEIENGNLKPVVFLYDLSNPEGIETGLYRQTPQHCEYPKSYDGNGAYVSWDPNGDGSEDFDPNSHPFRGQINIDTVLEYLERNIPNFKDHAIISLPFFARAVNPNSPDRTNTYSIAEKNGFSGETDECGETTFTDPLNPTWGVKAFPFDSMLGLSRNLTAKGYKDFTVWQANLDTLSHDYLTELSDVWTLGTFLEEINSSGEQGYVQTPHVFLDGSTLWVSPYNAYFKDSEGNDISGSFINGTRITKEDFQLNIEKQINMFRSNNNNDAPQLGNSSSGNNSNDALSIGLGIVGGIVGIFFLYKMIEKFCNTTNLYSEAANQDDIEMQTNTVDNQDNATEENAPNKSDQIRGSAEPDHIVERSQYQDSNLLANRGNEYGLNINGINIFEDKADL
ncbi:MAG: hypothetical protein VXX85_04175 [Candidatus Margulisiibacteriota bacterium]|nr:hypothetical protein [Candidatus Margulisiibacteriota bacterium]